MTTDTNAVREYWFKRFIVRYGGGGKMRTTDEQRRQINLHLDAIESARRGLDALAIRMESDGYHLAGSLVRDGMDYLSDITWIDFTADIGDVEDEPNVDNAEVVNT